MRSNAMPRRLSGDAQVSRCYRRAMRPPIRTTSRNRFRALLCLTLLPWVAPACLDPASERADIDETIGLLNAPGLELRVRDGLAVVREHSATSVVLWQSAPRIEIALRSEATSLELSLHNTMPQSVVQVISGAASISLLEPTGERPYATQLGVRLSGALASGVVLSVAPPDSSIRPFRIALMSDVQEAINRVQDLYQAMNLDSNIEFLLGAGDLTQRGTGRQLRRFEQELQRLNVPYYTTLGNHELGTSPPLFQSRMGRASLSFVYRDVRFTLIDSASATVAPSVLAQLEDWLRLGRHQVHVVAMHIPPVDPSGIRNGSFASRHEASALLSELRRGAVDLTLYGHIHSYYAFDNAGIPARISGGGGAIPERFDRVGRHYLTIDFDPAAQSFQTKLVPVGD